MHTVPRRPPALLASWLGFNQCTATVNESYKGDEFKYLFIEYLMHGLRFHVHLAYALVN